MQITQALILCSDNKIHNLEALISNQEIRNFEQDVVFINTYALSEETQETFKEALKSSNIIFLELNEGLARKRKLGYDIVKNSSSIIHFIDDDFHPGQGYFKTLSERLKSNEKDVACGAYFRQEINLPKSGPFRTLFLLGAKNKGKILRSGWTTNAQAISPSDKYPTEPIQVNWLSGCSMSYKSDVLNKISWPTELEGYSMDEDLILSYQASIYGNLVLLPVPGSTHHRELRSRKDPDFKSMSIKARHHFVQKYFKATLSTISFHWSTIGIFFALAISWRKDKGLFSKFLRLLLK